jgi:hypothetical protein
MWPGADLPVGPPPPSRPPLREPPPVRPIAGWYALPVILLVGAVILVIVAFAANWDQTEAADGPRATGDVRAGLEVTMTGGHDYLIYVRTGDSKPTSCTVAREDEPALPVPLRTTAPWAVTPPTGHVFGAAFEAPLSGDAELTCRGTDGDVTVVPDDTVYGYVGLWFIVAMFVGGVGVVSFVVVLGLRIGSARRRRQAMAAPLGPRNPYGPF